MVYGGIGLDHWQYISEKLIDEFESEMQWYGCISNRIKWENFKGSYFYDPNLPFSDKDFLFIDEKNEILVFMDGFIYNHQEIVKKLNLDKLHIDSPRLVYHAYLKWGEDFVKQLNGDFAICIYQKKNNNALFFRDHLGIRPLAICRLGPIVYFSTDTMGFCKALFKHEKIEPDFLLNLFLAEGFNYFILPNKKVEKIRPGYSLHFTLENQFMTRYWQPEKIRIDNRLNFIQVKTDLEILLKDAIKIRSDHRFIASAHVSGGIDSGVVSVLTRKEFAEQQEFYGYSWTPDFPFKPEDIAFDERLLVNGICVLNNMTPIYIGITVNDCLNQKMSWHYPSEIIFEHKVVEFAREKKINLIFSGWGGDEFISINNRGIDVDLIRKFSWFSFLRKYPIWRPKKLIGALLFNVFFPSILHSYSMYKTDSAIYPYIKNSLKSNLIPRRQRFHYGSRRKVHLQLLDDGHLATRTGDWHVLGHRNGVEYRYPLLDKRIVEYMLKVPSKCLVDGSNYRIILRAIAQGILPKEVINNISKDDPVKSRYSSNLGKEITKILIQELNSFRKNHELDFVNFALLENNISLFQKTQNQKYYDSISSILANLKYADVFTKGYYHRTKN